MFQYSSSHGSTKGACPVVCDLHTCIVSTSIEMHIGSAPHPCFHVVVVTYTQWFMATNLQMYYNYIHGCVNGLFQVLLKCCYNHRRHTWCYMYFELSSLTAAYNGRLLTYPNMSNSSKVSALLSIRSLNYIRYVNIHSH